jgi:demethylspheroidene O-methyltransferase
MHSEPYAAPHESVAGYSQLMTGSLPMIAEEILDAYPFQNHRSVMDVGGGEGAFVAALARRRPGLQLHLIDLPDVAARAHQRFRGSGLADRIATHGIDFLTQPLPSGSDAITLVRIVHDHDDAAVATLLRAVWRALAPGGSLIIAEPMSHTRGAERVADAYFALYLLAMGSGRPRSPNELRELIAAAGFVEVRLVETRLPMLVRLLVALKPSRHEWM